MNLERIETIVRLAAEHGLGEIVVETEAWRVAVKRPAVAAAPPVAPAAEAPAPAPPEPERVVVRAPLVGIFRANDPPTAAGDPVAAGDTLGRIESMRILNPVTTETAGVVVDVLVEEGDPVEYGQELFVIEPTPAGERGR